MHRPREHKKPKKLKRAKDFAFSGPVTKCDITLAETIPDLLRKYDIYIPTELCKTMKTVNHNKFSAKTTLCKEDTYSKEEGKICVNAKAEYKLAKVALDDLDKVTDELLSQLRTVTKLKDNYRKTLDYSYQIKETFKQPKE